MNPSVKNRLIIRACIVVVAALVLSSYGSTMAFAQDGGADAAVQAEPVVHSPAIPWQWYIAPIAAVIALIMAMKFYKEVRNATGTILCCT